MVRFNKEYHEALQTIESAQLPDIECFDLTLFITCSAEPNDAARYTLQRISQNSGCSTVEETLRSIRQDFMTLALKMCREDQVAPGIEAALHERDGCGCCITGSSTNVIPTYVIAPSVLDDRDLCPGGYLRPLLEAAVSKEKVQQMFTLLKESELKNLWLMAPSVRKAFRHGHFEIIKSPYLEMEGEVVNRSDGGWWLRRTSPGSISPTILGGNDTLYRGPSTTNPNTHPLPAELLLKVHGIISRRLHFDAIENQIKAGWPPIKQESKALGRIGIFFLRVTLLLFPVFVRRSLYRFIDRFVEYQNPKQKGWDIKLLPFGLCLKKGRENTANEANALLLAEKHTSINAPKLIDSVPINKGGKSGFILMTRIFGDRLSDVFYRTTHEEREQIGKDLAKWISEFRGIPNQTNYLIADTLGGPISDHRFSGETWGPFNTTTDFTDRLIQDVKDYKDERPLSVLYEKKHGIYFTHSDLHMSNLFVQAGRLSGIIDWENAGFKPEYWEFTRSLWPYGGSKTTGYIYRCAFGDKYEEEMEVDKFILLNGTFIF